MPPVPAGCVGADLGRRELVVTLREVLAYAAVIGADAPLHMDDARSGGVVAPPAFTVALEWPVIDSARYLAAIGRDERSAFYGLVHGFQASAFHRPIRPGDRLSVAARIVAAWPTRAGAVVVTHIATTAAADGGPVADGWFGALYRGAALDGAPASVADVPVLRDGSEFDPALAETIPIPRALPHLYTECARIWNPIHTERSAALADGLPDIILHGTCTWAMALQRLAARYRVSAEVPFRRAAARFSGMVVPGAPVTLEHLRPDAGGEIRFTVRTAGGNPALTHAAATLA